MRHQRWVMLAFVCGAILVGISVQAGSDSLFVALRWPDTRWFGFLNTTTGLSLLAGAVTFIGLIRSRKSVGFTDEVVDELSKVTWPSKEETMKASTTVVFTTLFTAAVLGAYDFLWKNLADIFLFTEG